MDHHKGVIVDYLVFLDALSVHYFKCSLKKLINQPKVFDWLDENWREFCMPLIYKYRSVNVFLNDHRLRIKLIQPPEDLK